MAAGRMQAWCVVLALVALTLAGCSDAGAPASGEADGTPDAQFVEDRGRGNITVDQPTLPTEPPAEGERTLDAAPQWRLGEWWTYRLTDQFTGETRTFTRVVAGTEHGVYLVGFPIDAFHNDVMVIHTPGFGDIRPDLSYDAHDVPFTPLKFPLIEGDSWNTQWESETATGTVLVEEVDAASGTARLSMSATANGGPSGELVYDAETGEIVTLDMTGYVRYEITDHGYGYDGIVRVPHNHDLVFYNGRFAGVLDASQGLTPEAVTTRISDTVTVDEGYDQVSFAAIFLDIAGATLQGPTGVDGATGYYSVTATAPDGTEYSSTFTPADGASIKIEFFGHERPAGDWQIQAVAAGPGLAFLEGIGYHSIDIDLPSGCVLASANANHHGTLCKAA